MDIEKLIEQLKWWAKECDRTNKGCQARRILQDAATAFSTLQAENAQLLTELEQVKRERDAAEDCIYKIEDDLDRGTDNDWAREHISEWESQKEG